MRVTLATDPKQSPAAFAQFFATGIRRLPLRLGKSSKPTEKKGKSRGIDWRQFSLARELQSFLPASSSPGG
jgi:hypothetical protein